MIGMRNAYKISVVKAEVKTSLGRPRYRWENNKMDIKDIRCGIVPFR
jgi:hypothetical protein